MTSLFSGPAEYTIKIGEYTFICCYCFDHTQNNRQSSIIFLKSTHETTPTIENNFFVIQSLSEIGLWRLFYPENFDKIYKGNYDYIQQTMINVELQIYLDKYFSTARKSNRELFDTLYNEFILHKTNIKNHIDDSKRFNHSNQFIDYTKYPKNCGFLGSSSIDLLENFSQELESKYTNSTPKVINKINKTINLDLIYKANLNGYIFSTELTHKDSCSNYILYFIRYTLEIPEKTVFDCLDNLNSQNLVEGVDIVSKVKTIKIVNYYAPIVLVKNDTISKYGTYENYIFAGAYICKILDYKKQSPLGTEQCSVSYNFIGEIYQSIFPYKNFTQKDIDQLISHYELSLIKTSFDYDFIKYLKYKEKYLKLKNKLG